MEQNAVTQKIGHSHPLRSIAAVSFVTTRLMKDKLGVDIWYCDPHSPWQRGMIENTNGILRRDMPRKSDISDYTDKDIETIQHLLNCKRPTHAAGM